MRNVMKALAATTLIGAGGTALAGVAYLQANPLALTTPKLLESSVAEAPPAVDWPAYATFLPATGPVSQVADQGPPTTLKRTAPAPGTTEPQHATQPPRLVPCSDWLDMGPANVTLDDGPKRRRVRMLCPEGAPVGDYYTG